MAKVLVKLQNGEEIKGDLLSLAFDANTPVFYIHADGTEEKAEKLAVPMASVKAVYFLKKEPVSGSVVHTETIGQSVYAGTYGFRLHIEFSDGELIHGSAHKYSPNDKGFYVIPLNPADRYERVYVNAGAVKRVESRRLLGKILLDQKKISPLQLEHAMRYQQEKRAMKLGTILKEQNYITHEQLEESLRKQTGRTKYLGEILLEAGYITEEQLGNALRLQQDNRIKKLGQILVELRYLGPNDICVALATQLHLPWADLSEVHIPPEVGAALPEAVIRQLQVIPVALKDGTLVVATAEPQEPGIMGEIVRHTKLNIELAVAYDDYIASAIDKLFAGHGGK